MEIGLTMTQRGPSAQRETILAEARLAEELGYDSLWVGDHVVLPWRVESPYPYTATGEYPFAPELPHLEALTLLTFLAGCTERPLLGVSVLVVPQRNPVLTAKVLASLDVLSGGRLILGVGAGWLREEFEALDMPFDQRGARTNEFVELMKVLWTQDHPRFQGRFYRLGDVAFYPKPLQKPHIPLWVGGEAEATLRRTAMLGDSYHVVDFGHEPFENTVERYRRVQALTKEYGRDPGSVSFTLCTLANFSREDVPTMVRRFQRYREAGVIHARIDFRAGSPEETMGGLRRFAREVRPALAG